MNSEYIYNEIFNSYDIEDVPYDSAIDSAYQLFIQELSQSTNGNELYQNIKILNTRILEILCQLNIDTLFISITTSESLFYRFSIKDFEFKLEVFYNIDIHNNDSIEATLHVYKSQEKQNSFYGTINDLTNVIYDCLPNKYTFTFEFEMI